jgi:hypothetical protein
MNKPKFSLCDSDRRIDLCSSIGREGTGLENQFLINKKIEEKKTKPTFSSMVQEYYLAFH